MNDDTLATRRLTGWQLVALAATLLIAVGSFGPWATLGIFKVNGLDGSNDGWVMLAAAALAAVASWRYYNTPGTGPLVTMLGLAIVTAAVGIYDAREISGREADLLGETVGPSVGWGLYLVIAASVVLAFAALQLRSELKAAERPAVSTV